MNDTAEYLDRLQRALPALHRVVNDMRSMPRPCDQQDYYVELAAQVSLQYADTVLAKCECLESWALWEADLPERREWSFELRSTENKYKSLVAQINAEINRYSANQPPKQQPDSDYAEFWESEWEKYKWLPRGKDESYMEWCHRNIVNRSGNVVSLDEVRKRSDSNKLWRESLRRHPSKKSRVAVLFGD